MTNIDADQIFGYRVVGTKFLRDQSVLVVLEISTTRDLAVKVPLKGPVIPPHGGVVYELDIDTILDAITAAEEQDRTR